MATKEDKSQSWKRPDELMRLQRLKQKKKQLAARFNSNNNNNNAKFAITETDKSSLLEAKMAQKRKNPFAKSTENSKKPKTDLESEDSLMGFISSPALPKKETFVKETPTRPPPAKLVLQPFDPNAFSKLLQQSAPGQEDEDVVVEQNITKHLPMDWSIKSRVRFFCCTDLPATQLKTSQLASGLTSFVRCLDTQKEEENGLDISPATRFNQATYYWQHPHIPWMTLFPRNARENAGITVGERERKALAEDWDYSFRGLFQLLRARQCAYFYLCANGFTVLFRAAGTGGRAEIHALMSPSTRGMRHALRQEGIEYTMPLKKDGGGLNKSVEGENSNSPPTNGNLANSEGTNEKAENSEKLCNGDDAEENADDDDDDEEEGDDWLHSLGVDEKEIRKIQTAHQRKLKAQEMSEDFSDNSLLLIEGVECQGFFSFLLNAKSTISSIGRLAGVPPTLLSPVAFPKATMMHLNTRSSKVRMDGVDYFSIEVKGTILPSFLPYICHLLGETKDTFSATLASSMHTLAFSKATHKLLVDDSAGQNQDKKDESEQQNAEIENAAGQVFGKENLSDCGLQPYVVENMCRTGNQAVTLLERVCYDKEYGFAWS
ncbi:protein downstream neighbor of son homolog [Musca domestica]|uniref:Protein downstream neighbor of son homolog n=1 Tax=Musca domestica TaxID=7370 RepID=A0A1I8N9F9_MUSDO|nr:protein downstream neighbor of son homolog [Musca domestica]